MEQDSSREAAKNTFIQELYERIESYIAIIEKARNDLVHFSELLRSCIRLYEEESGQKLPEEMLQRAGITVGMTRTGIIPLQIRPMAAVTGSHVYSIPEAVFEVMKTVDGALSLNDIFERVLSRGYGSGVKNPKEQVRIALIRGVKRGLYERVAPNTFRVNPSIRSKRYQEVSAGIV